MFNMADALFHIWKKNLQYAYRAVDLKQRIILEYGLD